MLLGIWLVPCQQVPIFRYPSVRSTGLHQQVYYRCKCGEASIGFTCKIFLGTKSSLTRQTLREVSVEYLMQTKELCIQACFATLYLPWTYNCSNPHSKHNLKSCVKKKQLLGKYALLIKVDINDNFSLHHTHTKFRWGVSKRCTFHINYCGNLATK